MTSAGIREAEVLIDGKNIWSGEVIKAHGNKMFNYSTPIVFLKPKEEQCEIDDSMNDRGSDMNIINGSSNEPIVNGAKPLFDKNTIVKQFSKFIANSASF